MRGLDTGAIDDADRPGSATSLTPPEATRFFLGSAAGAEAYEDAISQARDSVMDKVATPDMPYSGTDHEQLRERFDDSETLPSTGADVEEVIETVADEVVADSVQVSHEACVAHLQCPPTVPSLAAEVLLSATNQSMDSFDQAPAATLVEEAMTKEIASLFDYPDSSDGVFTSGGTLSNVLGLLLARDWYCQEQYGVCVQTDGTPEVADRLRVLCSSAAHFTAKQAAHQLGLGEDAVVMVQTDAQDRIDLNALDRQLDRLTTSELSPFVLVGTAGTTDAGAIDPLGELANRAREYGLWFHVDAAYGGACAFSDRLAPKIDGIERADSIALDFHKLCFQPVSCGAFLVRNEDHYRLLDRNAAYLNPERDDEAGVPNLVGKSLQTSRRFDALKPYVTFQTMGKSGLADCIEYVCDLTTAVATTIRKSEDLELCYDPPLSTVVFRYIPDADDEATVDAVNRTIRDDLLDSGEAVLARTEVNGTAALKCTLLNPCTTRVTLESILMTVCDRGRSLEREIDQ